MTELAFFSGGSALGHISRYLSRHNIPSSHLITTFDNGGSTAILRESFRMPAVGDLRNRMLALAAPDCSDALLRFLKLRLNPALDFASAARQFSLLVSPFNANWKKMPGDVLPVLTRALEAFRDSCPENFNYANASIGNIILAGLYLSRGNDLLTAIREFGEILRIRGQVAPITLANLHLGARMINGQTIIGQEKFVAVPCPIREIFLTDQENGKFFARGTADNLRRPPLTSLAKQLLDRAKLICYPPGSFYSSLLANLLTEGTGETIAQNNAVKVMIPNSGIDPEQGNLEIARQAAIVLQTLKLDYDVPDNRFLHYILVDSRHGQYAGDLAGNWRRLEKMGIKVIDADIVSPINPKRHLPGPVISILLKLAKRRINAE